LWIPEWMMTTSALKSLQATSKVRFGSHLLRIVRGEVARRRLNGAMAV
jgi:hypothetical protein